MQGGSGLRFVRWGRSKDHANAIGAFDNVIVGDDVAVRVNDDARAEAAFAANGAGALVVLIAFIGAETGDEDFDDGGRGVVHKRFERGAHFADGVRRRMLGRSLRVSRGREQQSGYQQSWEA